MLLFHPWITAIFVGVLSYLTGDGVVVFLETGSYTRLLIMCGIWLVVGLFKLLLTYWDNKRDKLRDKAMVLAEQITIDWDETSFIVTIPEITDGAWRMEVKIYYYALKYGMKKIQSKHYLKPGESDGTWNKYMAVDKVEQYYIAVDIYFENTKVLSQWETFKPGQTKAFGIRNNGAGRANFASTI